ncbi:hypothetical protein ONE63_008043 [Megalurothrips usitatus]|uniref:ATP-dependent DNA helicase n=1 Tax=Megalurothrips usitatus TaxID=439358 RepID=A0AAV7XX63_9NEOP|nr:hypothetical protein ONE63_008043 [Megalurothrips usitatus]
MHEDSNDIFEKGLLDHYCDRPHVLEKLSLAEFAANYRFSSSYATKGIPLLNEGGYIFERTSSRILRFRNYYYEMDPDNYMREHIMLYYDWRDEERDILNRKLEELFLKHEKRIQKIKKQFHSLDDTVLTTALEEASQRLDESIATEKPDRPTFDFDTYSLDDSTSFADIQKELQDDSKSETVKFTSPQKMNDSDFQNLFEKLNQDQRDYITHVTNHFKKSSKQMLHFLTGGAGVGKSLVINTLYQTLFRLLNSSPDSDPDIPKILLCAPTGKASFNIGGQTIHSAFKLPLNQKELNHLSSNISHTLSTKLHDLKVLIIDEISMVGQHILDMIDQRLRHLLCKDVPFGGVSVITVGDFFQLRPVCARPLYYPESSNPYAEIFGETLWRKFKVFQLKKIMRQNEMQFQVALNNLARGKLTKSDIRLFRKRTFKSVPHTTNFDDAVHLFTKNEDLDNYNKMMLNKIKGRTTNCAASDILRGTGSQLEYRFFKKFKDETYGFTSKKI